MLPSNRARIKKLNLVPASPNTYHEIVPGYESLEHGSNTGATLPGSEKGFAGNRSGRGFKDTNISTTNLNTTPVLKTIRSAVSPIKDSGKIRSLFGLFMTKDVDLGKKMNEKTKLFMKEWDIHGERFVEHVKPITPNFNFLIDSISKKKIAAISDDIVFEYAYPKDWAENILLVPWFFDKFVEGVSNFNYERILDKEGPGSCLKQIAQLYADSGLPHLLGQRVYGGGAIEVPKTYTYEEHRLDKAKYSDLGYDSGFHVGLLASYRRVYDTFTDDKSREKLQNTIIALQKKFQKIYDADPTFETEDDGFLSYLYGWILNRFSSFLSCQVIPTGLMLYNNFVDYTAAVKQNAITFE